MSQDPQLASDEAKRFFLDEDVERGGGVMVPYVPRTPDDLVDMKLAPTARTPRATDLVGVKLIDDPGREDYTYAGRPR
eukprot:661167-Prorocentrum_minimum.AAC.2